MYKSEEDKMMINKAIKWTKPSIISKKTDYPLTDSEFMNIDDELYSIINSILYPENEHTMNEDENLHNWFCDIRNKLCQQIHNKKLELNEGQYDKTKKFKQLEFNFN